MIVPARLAWAADGTPRSENFDDVYHSDAGGLEQAQHVFIAGNNLPQRWQGRRNFTILETGFGLGLSFLATWQAWQTWQAARQDAQHSAHLHFVSTELHPFTRADLATLHARWPELAELAAELRRNWPPLTPGFHHLLLDNGRVTLTLLFGDANDTLGQLVGQADAIYLDGFAPHKNPQLWSPQLLALLHRHAAPDATLASWCVAGEVRSALAQLGWHIRKRPGFARKWQMLTATLNGTAQTNSTSNTNPARHDAIVIGAGIAGCSAVEALTRRGWRVALIERNSEPALEASGNPVGLLHPMLARDDNLAARFSRAAYLYSLRLLEHLGHDKVRWRADGILQIAAAAQNAANAADEADATVRACCQDFPPDYVAWLNHAEANERAGLPIGMSVGNGAGACWFPHGAWVNPRDLCQALLNAAGSQLTTHYGCTITDIRYLDGLWHVYVDNDTVIAVAAHLILANAASANTLLPELHLTLRNIRGQLSYLPQAALAGLRTALCGAGYAIRTDELSVIGASFVEGDDNLELRIDEHADNLAKLAQLLPELKPTLDPATLPGRVSFRAASHDRLPLVGTLPQAAFKVQHTLANLPRQAGLHAMLGFGARGLTWAPFAAELLAAQLCAEILPLEQSLIRAIDPARHHLRCLRRGVTIHYSCQSVL